MSNTSIDDDMTNLMLDPSTELKDFDERSKTSSTIPELSEKEKMELENFDAQLEVSSQVSPEIANFDNRLEQSNKLEQNNERSKAFELENDYEQAENKLIADGIDKFLIMQDVDKYETTGGNYVLEKTDTGDISISDQDNNQLFLANSNGAINNQLSAEQTEDFTDFAANVDEAANNKILEAANKFLDLQEKDYRGTTNYFFERTSDADISITSKSNGEEIFKASADGSIEENLRPEEAKNFLEFAKTVDRAMEYKEQAVSQKEL